jgi:ABC-type phosphate transport system substrate-binding protein
MDLFKSIGRPVLAAVTIALAACGGVSGGTSAPQADVGSGNLTGAGATFPEPFYTRAFYAYSQSHQQVTVNYQAVGSGAGIQQFTKGTVDFGRRRGQPCPDPRDVGRGRDRLQPAGHRQD